MGAWRDLVSGPNQPLTTSGPFEHMPSPIQALKARPLRTLVLALGTVIATTFLFAAFGGPGNSHLRQAYSSLRPASTAWTPSWIRAPGMHDYHDSADLPIAGVEDRSHLVENVFAVDKDDHLLYPADFFPSARNPYQRAKATFVSLVRNGELGAMRQSMREVEAAFNRKFGYPWVFLNDEPFTEEFKKGVRVMTRSEIYFGVIPKEHWGYPDWVDQEKAAEERRRMEEDRVIYGGSESYRHMCRFNSGFFYRHELLQPFDWYWRVEPGVEFYCDIDYDPFIFMERNNKTYSFTVAIYEYGRTIESLWPTVKEFARLHPEHIAPDNALAFLSDDTSRGLDGSEYNLCHFWSNFEIADLRFWRSKAYSDYFDYLDATGGFFYERWGDAPVHSIAAALFLPASRLHQFDDIAYRHNPYMRVHVRACMPPLLIARRHCPINTRKYHDTGRCTCDPKSSFDRDGYSCMRQWWRIGLEPDKVFVH